ncbi:MAG: class I SAM-dependent methyltransferase [Verrucomicrobiae bacterium]|nr:class I SAM-dependent methyltransferase [Verrucomicrobiae bacterium]MCX7721439.1 class I SAM-dependent methyltransferase [Verrucomicrobiae bacterium]MDW7980397.1 class I SAM-dependent methyltransferase [Verrucomicrobiales bacterium]
MERVPEPELMLSEAQARAYAHADFAQPHSRYVELFASKFPDRPARATVLDLGCGACDVTIRFALANPGYRFDAVDGSPAMLKYARRAIAAHGLGRRIRVIHGVIPAARLPRKSYDVVLCTSFLHHLHDPSVLWSLVRRYARPGAIVFVADLKRPASTAAARRLVEKYSADEPAILKRDFFNSLCAAFTPAEVRAQLRTAGLSELDVEVISDRHLLVCGVLGVARSGVRAS